jgi:serine/threonine protein kinase
MEGRDKQHIAKPEINSAKPTLDSLDADLPTTQVQIATPPSDDESTRIINRSLSAMLIDNRFLVEKRLGQGGFGKTYLALDNKNENRPVVIKVLLKQDNEQTRAWVERHFRQESTALARINHPGIVKLIAFGNTEDHQQYIAMEFVEGYSLQSQIRPEKGIEDFDRVARIVRQLGEAISAAHDNGVYHRDLKPENILMHNPAGKQDEQVKVIDFGISTVKESLDEETKATVLAGSIRYMAPEQLLGRPSASSDVYALGVIAYEMVTGRTPFNPDARHPVAAASKLAEMQRTGVRVMPVDLRPSLPSKAQEVILKALEYNPVNRYRRADEFGNELSLALTTRPQEAELEIPHSNIYGMSSHSGALRKSRRNRQIIVALSALLLIGVLSLGLYFWSDRANQTQSTAPQPARTLSYWGEVRARQTDASISEAVRFSGMPGQMYFKKEDYLRLFFKGSEDGHLYLIHEESRTDDTKSDYSILFPTPATNHNSSAIRANREVASSQYYFYGKPGVERVWIVWAREPVDELEVAIRNWSNQQHQGEIKNSNHLDGVRQVLEKGAAAERKIEPDLENGHMNLRTESGVLVYKLSLDHTQ